MLRWLVASFVLLAAMCLTVVKVQQRIFRHHVERLLADLRTVELHKSTWADAQRLMQSWGRWGHWEGECSAAKCRYDIMLEDGFERISALPEWAYPALHFSYAAYHSLGGHVSTIELSLVVRGGVIVRTGLYASMQVPPDRKDGDEYGYVLFTSAVSLPRLARDGEPERLETDPYYAAARPGGCTICMAATLVYSDWTPQVEVRRLTALNTTCFSTRGQCRTVEDLMPGTEPFHLYEGYDSYEPKPKIVVPASPPHACGVPLWVRGRDASTIVRAQQIGPEMSVHEFASSYKVATMLVLSTLKGGVLPSRDLRVVPFQPTEWQRGIEEKIEPGKQYLLFGFEHIPFSEGDRASNFRLDRCSVVEATAAADAEVHRGMALDDELTGQELPHFSY